MTGRSFHRVDRLYPARADESVMATVPWAPQIDVLFDPRSTPGMLAGKVRIYASVAMTRVLVAEQIVTDPRKPFVLTAATGCDHYEVTVSLGPNPNPSAQEVYVCATAYASNCSHLSLAQKAIIP